MPFNILQCFLWTSLRLVFIWLFWLAIETIPDPEILIPQRLCELFRHVSTCFDQGCISLNAHMVDGRTLGVARVASPCHHVTMAWSGAMATVATVAWAEALGSIAESQRKPRPAGGRIHTSCEVTNRWKKRDIQILRSIEEHSVTHSYKRLQEATRGYKLIKQYWSWVFLVPVSVFQMWLESLSLQKTETTVENAVARKSLGFIRREWCIRRWRPSPNHPYPLVNIQKTMERSTMLLMGKSTIITISTGPLSMSLCWFTRGYHPWLKTPNWDQPWSIWAPRHGDWYHLILDLWKHGPVPHCWQLGRAMAPGMGTLGTRLEISSNILKNAKIQQMIRHSPSASYLPI